MGFNSMVEFLDLSYKAKDYIVPCLIGPVGIGKTAAVQQHAKNVGANRVVEIIASQILPTEISGIKMPDNKTKSMIVFDDKRLSELEDGDILFFDELLEADQMVLSACLTLIESRTMLSGKKLPEIQIIAATNPTISAQMLKPSIRQRFLFKDVAFDRDEFGEYIFNRSGINFPVSIFDCIESNSEEYNIISPRSFTKYVDWICTCDNSKDRYKTARLIDSMHVRTIGSHILEEWRKSHDKNFLVKEHILKIADAVSDNAEYNVDNWEDMDLSDFMEIFKALPEWEKIVSQLNNTKMEELM